MDILIDSNIIVDWLQQRQAFYMNARAVMESCMFGTQNGYVSAHSLCDIYYILRKDFPTEQRLNLIRLLSARCTVIPETQIDFAAVTENPAMKDLEDGLQMVCAKKYGLDYIVTRNVKDFTNSAVQAIEPQEFLQLLNK